MTEPALTPEEWEQGCYEGKQGLPAHLRRGGYEFFQHVPGYETRIDLADDDREESPYLNAAEHYHALAAVCLYGQPFGFTREDVNALRWIVDIYPLVAEDASPKPMSKAAWGELERLESLADRIAALLPPETA